MDRFRKGRAHGPTGKSQWHQKNAAFGKRDRFEDAVGLWQRIDTEHGARKSNQG